MDSLLRAVIEFPPDGLTPRFRKAERTARAVMFMLHPAASIVLETVLVVNDYLDDEESQNPK
jgi:hypothetical protein